MPKLTWYINRLRAMSPGEVRYRLRHAAQTRVDRVRLTHERLPGWELPESVDPVPVPFFFDPADREEIRATWERHYPDELARLRGEARELLTGRARVLGRELTWTDAPDWHADVVHGGEWPRRFWSEVQIRNGGVKFAWELARHQHMMTLARAWFLLDDLECGTAACRWLKSWIDTNPPYTGIHWSSALELGLRLISWSWIYRLLDGHPAWTRELEREFYRLIQLQAEFVRRYHSAHSSANNHLIGEAAGVAMAGLAFPWLVDADRWRDWGLSVLAAELPRQCHPDGVGAEQAFHYQAFVMDLVLQPVLLGRYQSRETPVELPERLEAMAEFLLGVMDGSGGLPAIGDADDGAAIVLGQDLRHPYRSLLATCGVLFSRPEFCHTAGPFDEKSCWLLGAAGRERFQKLAAGQRTVVRCELGTNSDGLPVVADSRELTRQPERTSRQFEQGGYSVMRSGEGPAEQVLLLDHGPLGYLSIAAHGHADCLSLVMSLGGQPVLVDPGTYTYHEEPEWREYFRGTPAHNTLTVAGQHQSVMTGPTMWGQRAEGRCRTWVSQPGLDFVEAEHDGYQRLPGRPLHRRSVFHRRDGATVVVDQLRGDGTHSAELNWHLAAGTQMTFAGGGAWTARGDGYGLQIAVLSDATLEVSVVEGQEQPPQGWVSPQFGERVPAPTLSARSRGPLPLTWVTVLVPDAVARQEVERARRASIWSAGDGVWPAVSAQIDIRGAVVTLEYPGRREIYAESFIEASPAAAALTTGSGGDAGGSVAASLAGPPWLELGGGRFRGKALHLETDGSGRPVSCAIVAGTALEWGGALLWHSDNGPIDTCEALMATEDRHPAAEPFAASSGAPA